MMDLTIDEKMLILLYSPGTRMGLYGALQQMKEQLEEDETELLDLTNSVLQKLSDMDDEVFEKLSLSLDLFVDLKQTSKRLQLIRRLWKDSAVWKFWASTIWKKRMPVK